MEPNPKQALALWRMLTANTPELAEPKVSDLRPELSPAERDPLLKSGFVTMRTGKNRATHLVPTDKAWEWAARTMPVNLLKSRSPVGAEVLEALLNRLLPNLKTQGIALADVIRSMPVTKAATDALTPTSPSCGADVLSALRKLAKRSPSGAVRLASLRVELASFGRAEVDAALRALRDTGSVVLYQDDDRASLTEADHQAALLEANTPHHLAYLENR